jgi:hypothetical protein
MTIFKNSLSYFTNAQEHLNHASSAALEAGSYATQAVYSGARTIMQAGFGFAAFEWGSGKIISSYAAMQFAPKAVVPVVAKFAINGAFHALTAHPAASLAGTVVAGIALHPENIKNTVLNTAKAGYKAVEAVAYTSVGVAEGVAGAAILTKNIATMIKDDVLAPYFTKNESKDIEMTDFTPMKHEIDHIEGFGDIVIIGDLEG